MAKKLKMSFFETSSLTGKNVKKVLFCLSNDIFSSIQSY